MMSLGVGELADDKTDLEIAVPEDDAQAHLPEFEALIPPLSPTVDVDSETGGAGIGALLQWLVCTFATSPTALQFLPCVPVSLVPLPPHPHFPGGCVSSPPSPTRRADHVRPGSAAAQAAGAGQGGVPLQ
jgi:hypothetical protein